MVSLRFTPVRFNLPNFGHGALVPSDVIISFSFNGNLAQEL